MVDINHQIKVLSDNLVEFKHIFTSWNKDLRLWKRSDDSWCFLEVVCHLLDEEREDFRLRLKTVFEGVENLFLPIDPEGWVKERDYINKNFDEVANMFYEERLASLKYLNDLDKFSPNWKNVINHQLFQPMSPIYFLNNWVAHDYLHLRQLTRIKYDYLDNISDDSIGYAGNWV